MKKLLSNKNKNRRPKSVKHHLHTSGAVLVVVITAFIGLATLKFSLASTYHNTIIVRATDITSSRTLDRVGVKLARANEETEPCDKEKLYTKTDGLANFTNCSAWTPTESVFYQIQEIDTPAGYQIASSSPKKLYDYINALQGSPTIWDIHFTQTDSDGDGVPDLTDNCDGTAGPASNQGCPVVVVAPPPDPPKTTTTVTQPSRSTTSTSVVRKSTVSAPAVKSAPAIVSSTTGDKTPPSSPEGFTVDLNEQTAYLSWLTATDDKGVAGYNLERSTDNETWDKIGESITDTFYTDEELTPGETYYYRLRAVDTSGNQSEATLIDIDVAKVAKKAAAPNVKKSSSFKTVLTAAGIMLLLVAFFVAAWLIRRRMNQPDQDYDLALNSSPAPYVSADASQAQHQSLKDMVMDDMNRNQQPPVPPLPPPPANN